MVPTKSEREPVMALLAPESSTTGTFDMNETGSWLDTIFVVILSFVLLYGVLPRSITWPTSPQADRHDRHSSAPADGSPSRFITRPQMLAPAGLAGGGETAAAATAFFFGTCVAVEWVDCHMRHLLHQLNVFPSWTFVCGSPSLGFTLRHDVVFFLLLLF